MPDHKKARHSLIEEVFETALFNCRFLVLLAVLGSMLAAIMMFVKGSIELVQAAIAFLPSVGNFQPTHADDRQPCPAHIAARWPKKDLAPF